MNREEIKLKRQEIINRAGEWTSHNIWLSDDIYTYDQNHPEFQDRLVSHGVHLRRIIQAVSDITNQPLGSLRVLDLGCLEGLYGLEFAQHGAEVVAIEAREVSLEKSRFAKEVLGLDNITFVQDDVRNLSIEKYGRFDVVLCLGIFYHLNVPDVFQFTERLFEVCQRIAIIDTHVGLSANKSHTYKGQTYHGWTFIEHSPEATTEERLKSLWASLDNETSFWFTRPSLFNLLARTGFTSVHTCQNPPAPRKGTDSDTLVAIKGERQKIFCTPTLNRVPDELWPEKSLVGAHPGQQAIENQRQPITRRARHLVGRVLRRH